jgi:thiol-disulfide isomerase/thioredoxin
MTDEPNVNPDSDEFGRVGYGRLARYSPLILAAVMVAAVIFIALNQRDKETSTRDIIGEPAPAMSLISFDGGTTTTLAALSGNVVVLNFWASWCEPCRTEMPAFEFIHQSATGAQIIGVNIKNDRVEDAAQLLTDTGVTYPIVRDIGGEHPVYGPIEQALGLGGSYPMTVFVSPDGIIDRVVVGPMNESEILEAIDEAGS